LEIDLDIYSLYGVFYHNPEAASVLANDLNAGKAAPLLDYIFTQMNGLTRNSPNKRRYNVNDYPALAQPKDRIFGGLSDLLRLFPLEITPETADL
jgi:hypothetical protein